MVIGASKNAKNTAVGKGVPMTALSALTHVIIASFILIIPCKFIRDWQDFHEYRRDGAPGRLADLRQTVRKWTQRHCGCAMLAIMIYSLITRYPLLQDSERLSGITAAYALICLASAVAESVLAQRIEAVMQEF